MLLRDPSLEKFVLRAERQGYSGDALLQNATKRAEASELSRLQSRALERARGLATRGLPFSENNSYFSYVQPALGKTAESLPPSMRGLYPQPNELPPGYLRNGVTRGTRISQLSAYLNHEKYPEFYVRNFSRAYPMPLAAHSNIANKTLPVTATVSTAFTVPGGSYCVIAPTPDHPENVPYVSMMITPDNSGPNPPTVRTLTLGSWFGNISPQGLCGASPTTGNVDDRSLQFKAGVSEISMSVAYNATASIGYLDPYTTLDYGKALGYVRTKPASFDPAVDRAPYSSEASDWPYTTTRNFINFSDMMNNAVRQSLVGSTRQSSISFRQIIKPVGHSFNPAVAVGSMSADELNRIGWPTNTPLSNSVSANLAGDMAIFGQGLYLIDNSNSTTAVAVEMSMDMHYRVRVDNQAPAVYMMADDRSTPKHSITWEPSTAMAGGRTAAVEQSHRANATSASAPLPKPITPAASAIKGDSLPSSSSSNTSFLEKIPVVGKGVGKAAGGLERAFTKGDDVGELLGGLGDFALGTLDAMGSLFSFFD